MSASALLALGQTFHAAQFPATITFDGHTYTDASTGGLKRDQDLMSGGFLQKRQKAFWLPVASIVAAGKSIPQHERMTLTHGSDTYVIARAQLDPSTVTVTLHCEGPEQ